MPSPIGTVLRDVVWECELCIVHRHSNRNDGCYAYDCLLETWLLIAAKEGNPSILVFEVKSFESKRRFIGVVEGGDIGVGHMSTICTFILGI